MACLRSSTRSRLIDRYNKKLAQLGKADAAYDILLDKGDIESYNFDSGDGRQQVKRRQLSELTKTIADLESQLDAIQRRLSGMGLTTFNLSRRVRSGGLC